jgi:hypothetical protein
MDFENLRKKIKTEEETKIFIEIPFNKIYYNFALKNLFSS